MLQQIIFPRTNYHCVLTATFISLFTLLLSVPADSANAAEPKMGQIAIAIHGGAGTIKKQPPNNREVLRYTAKLREAVSAGHRVLQQGGTSMTAVITAIDILERSPLFNAGVGAVYTWDESHELDASIMDGATLNAGAVAGVRTVASPIRLAHAVMTQSAHVLLSGRGAESFAESIGMAQVTNQHFDTPARLDALRRAKAQAQHAITPHKWGTVGAVALDQAGNLAAGTSTGGMTGKRWGRVGDSPLIGAGTYADNRSCAVSATGHGEYFIRYNVAADVCARVRYQNKTVGEAGNEVLFEELLPVGGTGGVIILDRAGNIAMPFNTPGMYRASIDTEGHISIAIH